MTFDYKSRILGILSDGEWHCGIEFVNVYMLSYSQRVSNLNAKEVGRIVSEPCHEHQHRGGIYRYRDTKAAKPAQLSWQAA